VGEVPQVPEVQQVPEVCEVQQVPEVCEVPQVPEVLETSEIEKSNCFIEFLDDISEDKMSECLLEILDNVSETSEFETELKVSETPQYVYENIEYEEHPILKLLNINTDDESLIDSPLSISSNECYEKKERRSSIHSHAF